MMLRRINETGLRLTIGAVFVALLVPTILLVAQAYRQLEREAYFQVRAAAEQLGRQIDQQLAALVATEDARAITDYGFVSAAGDDFTQRSPLSVFPVTSPLPGVQSYFQIDAAGKLTTPLLPAGSDDNRTHGLPLDEYRQRQKLEFQIATLLSPSPRSGAGADETEESDQGATVLDDLPTEGSPDLASEPPVRQASSLDGQRVIESLEETAQSKAANALGRVADLKLNTPYGLADEPEAQNRPSAERALPPTPVARADQLGKSEPPPLAAAEQAAPQGYQAPEIHKERTTAAIDVDSFASEVEPFRFVLLDAAHFMLYRTVWRNDERSIQGMVIDRDRFLRAAVENVFTGNQLSADNDLIISYQGEVLEAYSSPRREYFVSADQVQGTLLYRTALSAPFGDLELIFSAVALPVSPGNALIMWTAAALVTVLVGGFWLMYRLGLQQLRVYRQQQDFVSAVSHELKTPLTSIRMYGEILRAGWASEDKKKTYYDYIFQESERLSRLINNVLQLARLTRNGTEVHPKPVSIGELLDLLRSKVATQLDQAGFELIESHADASLTLLADTDAFSQIIINLVDNAIKFSGAGDLCRIELSSRQTRDGEIEITVRDYGPGIPREQMKKIFELFYRSERELTRETVGTGIGLALVRELVTAMSGKINVRNADPGAEFRMRFPLHPA